MVVRIATPSSITRALNYNEQKVKNGVAELIHTAGFLKDKNELNFHEKLEGFTRLMRLNDAKTNSLHISLNFDNSDQLDKSKLAQIADDYMQCIGFGNQPYLVYQHHDAGHPHVHVVTTSIQPDGKRINTYNIGRNQSEKARREIEKEYGLIVADGRRQKEAYELKPISPQKVSYGKQATKQAITSVLSTVIPSYKYTSLPELNAVLRQYNVQADRGDKDSRIYKNNGLIYRVLDENGIPVGVPIKASDIAGNPGLKNLAQRFGSNDPARQPFKRRVKNAIDLTVLRSPKKTLPKIIERLKKESIDVVVRQNKDGVIYGLTYIDRQNKAVFNGSALGKEYSAKGMMERCTQDENKQQVNSAAVQVPSGGTQQRLPFEANKEGPIEILTREEAPDIIDAYLKRNPKKKRKNHRL
jgi:hypothetical protein